MTVVPFVSCRFVPSDVQRFMEFAGPRLERRIWQKVERLSDRERDQMVVSIPGPDKSGKPFLSFQRERGGEYGLWFWDSFGWHLIRSGSSADECLGVLEEGSVG